MISVPLLDHVPVAAVKFVNDVPASFTSADQPADPPPAAVNDPPESVSPEPTVISSMAPVEAVERPSNFAVDWV